MSRRQLASDAWANVQFRLRGSTDETTKALWNILSDKGRKVAVVGYWATWPAETVNGDVVSDHIRKKRTVAPREAGRVRVVGL